MNKEIEYQDSELKRVPIESNYLELQNILITEDKRINQKSVDKQRKKLDSLINIDNNEKSNEMNSTNTTHNSIINRTSLFITGNNRRKNKNDTARRKSNWLRPEQRELLEQLSRSKDIVLPEDMFNPINLTDQQLTEDELNVYKLGLKFIPTGKRYDRVKKWMDMQVFKRKVRLYYFHKLEFDDGNILSEGEEIIELSEPWKPKSKFDPPKTDNPDLELLLDIMEKELLNPKKEKRIQDNLKDTERTALYSLSKYNKDIRSKTLIRTQDKGSRLVMECKERYITEMFSYLNNKGTFCEDELDQSETYQQKVKDWTKSCEHKLTKEEVEWINKKEVTSGKVYANVKTHKENNPYRYIVSARGTAIENLARWVEYQLKELSRQHPAY